MTTYLAFNELEGVTSVSSSSNVLPTTSSTVVLAGVNRAGIQCRGLASFRANFTPISEGWLHIRVDGRSTSGVSGPAASLIREVTSEPIFEIRQQVANSNFYVRVPSDDLEDNLIAGPGTHNFDVNFKIAEAGFVKVFVSGSLVYNFSGDTRFVSGDQTVGELFCASTSSGVGLTNSNFFSNILISSEPTFGAKVYTLPLELGTQTDWLGTFTDVNGSGLDDETFIEANTNGDLNLMGKSAMPVIDSREKISSVVLSARGLYREDSPVTKINLVLDDGVTQTEFDTASSLSFSFTPNSFIANQNFLGATDVDWEVSDLNGMQIGLIART